MSQQPSPTTTTREPMQSVVVRGTEVPMADVRTFFDESFQTLGRALQQQGVAPTGPAFARYLRRPTDTMDLQVGFPVGAGFSATEEVATEVIPGGRAVELLHIGNYDNLGESWERLVAWLQAEGLRPGEWFLEEYLTEPTPGADPADMRTRLTYPVEEA